MAGTGRVAVDQNIPEPRTEDNDTDKPEGSRLPGRDVGRDHLKVLPLPDTERQADVHPLPVESSTYNHPEPSCIDQQ